MVADVDANEKTGPVVRFFQRGHHFKEVIERVGLPGQNTPSPFRMRELRQYFRHIIGNRPILDIRPAESMPDENVEIKPAGNAKAAATPDQGIDQRIGIEKQSLWL